ncbi:hypothetical protein SLEP1_g37184 [Rubroshorea leprosula]|uniref:Reverse transcriptase domain-containing protein n=1 Tax=Rubroshorea leprosula TaxID=152421 RepID=A0AAV5KU90_9ROSI|nr:hypothetical protein SLEP1_g37184 [Rubroshorea leprosula]
MVHTFTGNRPPRDDMDKQDNTQLLESDLNDFRPMLRNLFVGGVEQEQLNSLDDERTPTGGPVECTQTSKLEERTKVLEMALGRILSCLISDDPLIPLLNKGEQPAEIATRNSPALRNIIVPTRLRGSGKSNHEPNSSKHNEELMRKNANLERQLKDVQGSIDELKSLRSCQQALDLDSAPLNLSITAEPYQEGFKIPHLEAYNGSGDPDEHLHSITSYSQLATLFSNKFGSQREIECTTTELMQVHQKEGETLRDYMQRFNKATLDIDNVPDTICLSALLHGLKPGRFLDDLLENPPKSWNEGIGVLKGNQKMARTYHQDTFKKVELVVVHKALVSQKPNGKWRMCIDFTNLNEACPKDPHPLPNVEKLVEWAAGYECISFLDASSGYHQVQLWLDDQEKTAFYAGDAIYCYVMMPFGLKIVGATYQKLVQVVFKFQISKNIEVYVDDMIVTRKFLGYVVSKKGIQVNPNKVQAVQQMEPPKTVKDVQRLTGRLVALHRFIAKSTERCLPFFKALREAKNF